MKKMILTGTVILALAGASLQSARAGDREWATVGKVLTGVAAVGVVAAVVSGHAQGSVNFSYGAPAYCPPTTPSCNYVYCPPPAPPVICGAPAIVIAPPPAMVYHSSVVIYPAYRVAYYHGHRGCW